MICCRHISALQTMDTMSPDILPSQGFISDMIYTSEIFHICKITFIQFIKHSVNLRQTSLVFMVSKLLSCSHCVTIQITSFLTLRAHILILLPHFISHTIQVRSKHRACNVTLTKQSKDQFTVTNLDSYRAVIFVYNQASIQNCRNRINPHYLPICFSVYAASSGVALGMTPGSLKLVLSNADMTNINSNPPITGMAGVIRTARYGQLS